MRINTKHKVTLIHKIKSTLTCCKRSTSACPFVWDDFIDSYWAVTAVNWACNCSAFWAIDWCLPVSSWIWFWRVLICFWTVGNEWSTSMKLPFASWYWLMKIDNEKFKPLVDCPLFEEHSYWLDWKFLWWSSQLVSFPAFESSLAINAQHDPRSFRWFVFATMDSEWIIIVDDWWLMIDDWRLMKLTWEVWSNSSLVYSNSDLSWSVRIKAINAIQCVNQLNIHHLIQSFSFIVYKP